MASWETRAAKQKDMCEDKCAISDIGLLCSLACFIPWSQFISMPVNDCDPKCCVSDECQNAFKNLDSSSVSSERSINGIKKYKFKDSKLSPDDISRTASLIGSGYATSRRDRLCPDQVPLAPKKKTGILDL